MSDPILDELRPVVLGLIQPDDMSNSEVLEDLQVILWLIASLLLFVIHRAHEGNELVGNDPVQVSILYFFIVLVFLGVKTLE
jgi:hypothetical protein